MQPPLPYPKKVPQPSLDFVILWLAALVIVGAYLRTHHANVYYYSADELQDVYIAKGATLKEVLLRSLHEAHPPLGNFLRYFWMMFGESQSFVRGFSLMFGLALIPLYYFAGAFAAGRFAGLICAALITFSYGCVVQSYVVRNYTVFLFLLSLAFYCFLRWRSSNHAGALLGYTICACLACLTHFSGIFAVLAIGLYASPILYLQKKPFRMQAGWIVSNGFIFCVVGYVYYCWQASLGQVAWHKNFLQDHELIAVALAFPINALYYISPSRGFAFFLLAIFPLLRKQPISNLPFFLSIAYVAIGVGEALAASGLYPFQDSRHILWILPFLLTAAGVMLSGGCRLTFETYALPVSYPVFLHGIMLLLGICGIVSCLPSYRFADNSEYTITNGEWGDVAKTLAGFGPKDLIVSERSDAGFLVNPYPYLDSPYGHTRVLFRVHYMHYDGATLIRLFQEARARGELDGVDRLVFFRTSASRSAIINLTLCKALDKTIVTFPPLAEGRMTPAQKILDYPAELLILSKQAFFDEAVNPQGKAHSCLDPDIEY